MQIVCWGLHFSSGDGRPPSWPQKANFTNGLYTIQWRGTADISHSWCNFVPAMSNANETGLAKDGIRVLNCTSGHDGPYLITITAMSSSDPLTSLAVWLPDPDAPFQRSLANTTLFNPQLIKHLTTNTPQWGAYRFMPLLNTNANTERDWIDRNLPSHSSFGTVLAPRGAFDPKYTSFQASGSPWEYVVALCNLMKVHCYINIPAMASDQYVSNVAGIFRYGSDGVNPYTSAQASPVWAPLDPSLQVYIE
jgi:hypothetical protein